MPPIPGMTQWHSLIARHAKTLRSAWQKATRTIDAHLSGQPQTKLEALYVRNAAKHPLHPLARIRQGQNRFYSTARRSLDSFARSFTSGPASKVDRASFPKSRVSTYIAQSTGRAPFASTLRPNLTGGTLGRTAGGYSLGSGGRAGARYFSHTPASQAQVVHNVSQAVRAFFISGQKAQYDGVSPITGEKRYKAVSTLQESTGRKLRDLPKHTPGSWIDFPLNPSITALTSFPITASASVNNVSLNTEGLLDILSADFSRALKDLAAILNDLSRLSHLGDLPITHDDAHLRVHFPGCDAESVERLCEELGLTRGTVHQDATFDSFAGTEIALLFPFAPSGAPSDADDGASFYDPLPAKRRAPFDVHSMLTATQSPAYSTQSETSDFEEDVLLENPWLATSSGSPSGFESVRSGGSEFDPLEYQGFEGIYRFIGELDAVRARR